MRSPQVAVLARNAVRSARRDSTRRGAPKTRPTNATTTAHLERVAGVPLRPWD